MTLWREITRRTGWRERAYQAQAHARAATMAGRRYEVAAERMAETLRWIAETAGTGIAISRVERRVNDTLRDTGYSE